jgi:uncharacterized iron-regulated membrane protein
VILTSELFALILVLVLASGLVILWRRGADDLDAWGLFVVRVLRGERRGRERGTKRSDNNVD